MGLKSSGGRGYRVIVSILSQKEYHLPCQIQLFLISGGIDLGRMSSPANSWERESILEKNQSKCSQILQDSTHRSDSASKDINFRWNLNGMHSALLFIVDSMSTVSRSTSSSRLKDED
ncbi:hypothetical protein Tco_1070305 [Tanacetum coccineum]|uniref:Uncharacterized protein n=1 Tax=Tanacetum coccineum TaxID=301880 RepID=A0ABQ5HL26_9ASTR